MDIFPPIPPWLWAFDKRATDWYGNRVIGKGTCSIHQEVYMIKSPIWATPDCIWCYHLEAHSMGVQV